jgi:hypothetical protein
VNHWVKIATLPLIAALGSSCAVTGGSFKKVNVPPGETVIYVYRPYHYAASLLRPPVTCGEEMTRLGPGGYHVFLVPAGEKTQCSVQWTENLDQVEIDGARRVYYVREEFGWGLLSGHPRLNPVDADQAKSEIEQCCKQQPEPPG